MMNVKQINLQLMETQKNVYNIIWIDDDIDSFLGEKVKGSLEGKGFHFLGIARTYGEFVSLMEMFSDRVDAVITDANFNVSSLAPKSEKDLSGLEKVRESIAFYNSKRDIPFYLCTGRGPVLAEKYEDGQLDYFYVNHRYFSKSQLSKMFEKIKMDIEHINSPSFRIRKKYAKELKAASLIESNEACLMNALLYESSENWKNTEDFFNPLRKIVERILEECKKKQIVPQNVTLSGWKRFLENKDSIFCLKNPEEEIMPKPLVHSLVFLIPIIQDGSHGDGDLNLGVDSYVRSTKDINLFRSSLFITMDLCLWFESYCSSMPKQKQKWSIKKDAFVCKGKVSLQKCTDGEFRLVCENYALEAPKNKEYLEGDTIGIIRETGKNKYPFEYYSEDGGKIMVDKYTNTKNIVKLS